MATVFLSPIGNGWQFFDDNGDPLASGAVNTYAAGTTTPTATYTDSTGNTPNANPIPLNAAGRIATQVWLPQGIAVKFVPVSSVSTAVGVAQDNLYGINDPTTINGIGYTGATVSGALIMNLAPINEAQGANIAVAAAINLTTANGNYLQLTGSGTITSLQLAQGAERVVVVGTVSSAFQNSSNLIMLGGKSITPTAGDILGFRGEAPPVVRNVLYQSAGGFGAGAQARISSLSVDIGLGTSATYVDGPSVSCGAVGTWLAGGTVTVQDTSTGNTKWGAKIWDGTNVVASTQEFSNFTGAGCSITLFGYFTAAPVGNIRISVRDFDSNNGAFKFNLTGEGKDSTIVAVRIT